MATFRFTLASVARVREAARDERRAALAEALQAEQVLRERVQRNEEQLAALSAALRQASAAGKIDVEKLIDGQRYEAILRAELAGYDQQTQQLNAEIERRRLALVAADRDVKVMEQLHEKQRRRHLQDEARRETAVLDEVAGRGAMDKERPP